MLLANIANIIRNYFAKSAKGNHFEVYKTYNVYAQPVSVALKIVASQQ